MRARLKPEEAKKKKLMGKKMGQLHKDGYKNV